MDLYSFPLTKQSTQKRNQLCTDQDYTAATHQLFYVFYEKILARNEP